MSPMHYAQGHRELQDRFDSRRLADTLSATIVHDTLDEADLAFIAGRDMVWLATVDQTGMPTVSYKGGAPGFVKAPNPQTLELPSYDGNGMFYSMGNIVATAGVGLLFMDLETPFRLRVQGQARIDHDPAARAPWPGAQFIVRVAISAIFQNCPRYVHRHQRIAASPYVPDAAGAAPMAGWKRIDAIQPALAAKDQGKAEGAGGLLTGAEWGAMVASGAPDA